MVMVNPRPIKTPRANPFPLCFKFHDQPPREGANDSDYVAYKQAVCDSSEWQVSVSLPSVDVTMSKRSFDTVSLISERLSVWQAKIARTREHTDIHKGKEASLTSNGQ
ncbi:hypothetical protein SARC_18061, partial [Sphaeroforma arctica JP610]